MQSANAVSSTLAQVCVVVLLVLQAGCNERPPAANKNPEEVTVSQPFNEEVVEYAYFTGHVEAVSTVELRARVTGYLDDIFFKDGEIVKKGDKLFEIDQKPYKAALDQAKAAVSRSEAQLKTASLELNRQKELIDKQSTVRPRHLLVDDKNKVVAQRVRVGNLTDGLRVIEDGLRPTDWVITEGILRVRPGEVVAPKRQAMKRGV